MSVTDNGIGNTTRIARRHLLRCSLKSFRAGQIRRRVRDRACIGAQSRANARRHCGGVQRWARNRQQVHQSACLRWFGQDLVAILTPSAEGASPKAIGVVRRRVTGRRRQRGRGELTDTVAQQEGHEVCTANDGHQAVCSRNRSTRGDSHGSGHAAPGRVGGEPENSRTALG